MLKPQQPDQTPPA